MTEKKIAIVTGISSGIGKATALRLVEEGFIVYGGARRVDRLQELKVQGVRVQALDVTDEASNRALIDRVLNEEKRIDILVNNAGYGEYGALEEVTTEAAKKQFDVNLFGLANITQLVLPTMRAQQSGRIINISSIGGRIYSPAGGCYSILKDGYGLFVDNDTTGLVNGMEKMYTHEFKQKRFDYKKYNEEAIEMIENMLDDVSIAQISKIDIEI